MMLQLFLALLFLFELSVAEQCKTDENNPCIAECNGTTIDISKLFDYPLNISGFYGYKWSPCSGISCREGDPMNSAVCQKADQYYNCGQFIQPVYILQQIDPFMYRIEYPNGIQWRISIFSFTVTQEEPQTKVTFISEEPGLQYNFEVTGKCIGQPYCN